MNFGLLTAKNRTVILPTLRNHHLLGGGGHHVGLSLGVQTFLDMDVFLPERDYVTFGSLLS